MERQEVLLKHPLTKCFLLFIASRSIKSFFAATQTESNDKGDGGEKKRNKEDLVDGEVENVDGVVELRKQTEAKTSSYEKKIPLTLVERFQLVEG